MKFAIIGLEGENTFSRKMEKALKKLGHSVYFIYNDQIRDRHCKTVFKLQYHINKKYPLDLQEILPVEYYDMIIISHNEFVFNNPKIGSTKVLYYHREILSYPSCMNPDILAYNFPNQDTFIWHYYPKLWYNSKRIDLHFAVDPEAFNSNRTKDLKGLNFVSRYENKGEINLIKEKRDFMWNYVMQVAREREALFTSNGCRYNGNTHTPFMEYKDFLERSEAFLLFTSPIVHGSRRLMECAACKTLPIIHIQDREAESYYNTLGFEHGINSIMFEKRPGIYSIDVEEATENAYEMVLNNHTYDHRAKQILELLE